MPRASSAPPNRIRELRVAAGLTLEALAQQAGTTNQMISHLELGKRQLTVDWLRRLATVLKCHPWALVEDIDHRLGRSAPAETSRIAKKT